jgi:hypothetical protein
VPESRSKNNNKKKNRENLFSVFDKIFSEKGSISKKWTIFSAAVNNN